MEEFTKQELKLIRNQLGSVDLSDVKNIKLTEADVANREGDTELYYRNHFKNVLKGFIQEQLEFIGKQAEGENMLSFGRGTINGFFLIRDWMEEQSKNSLSRFKQPEEGGPTEEPFPE